MAPRWILREVPNDADVAALSKPPQRPARCSRAHLGAARHRHVRHRQTLLPPYSHRFPRPVSDARHGRRRRPHRPGDRLERNGRRLWRLRCRRDDGDGADDALPALERAAGHDVLRAQPLRERLRPLARRIGRMPRARRKPDRGARLRRDGSRRGQVRTRVGNGVGHLRPPQTGRRTARCGRTARSQAARLRLSVQGAFGMRHRVQSDPGDPAASGSLARRSSPLSRPRRRVDGGRHRRSGRREPRPDVCRT